jgi:drug/metabolite transporter (DMT)-like permease
MPVMADPPIFFEPYFVWNVMGGYFILLVGMGLLLLAGIWWSRAGEWRHREQPPLAWRGLSALGFVLFALGIVWQLIGYVNVGAVTWSAISPH